ncbi:MAG TPA: hypothetical protein VH253_00795, partial [Phycisphaerae bacterium]|nr:hypothetical protein [Phycisphaerae bacterium]
GATLDILVENMGRTSSPFDQKDSRKGLEGNPTLGGKPLTGWTIYPVDELGRTTPKYTALRDLLAKARNTTLPPIPPDPKIIAIPAFSLKLDAPLLSHLNDAKAVKSDDVKPMEDIGQNYGFTDYRTTLAAAASGTLELPAARDYVWILVNGRALADGLTNPKNPTFSAPINAPAGATLDILVENMGRTSSPFDQKNSRKGLEGNPTLNGKPLTGWTLYPIQDPADLAPANGPASAAAPTGPSLFTGAFTLTGTGETYLDMSNWKFGVVWVNGHNLGRFWDVGASRSLYLPSAWQKVGQNTITVLELAPGPATPQIAGVQNMVESPTKPFTPYWTHGQSQSLQHVPGQGDEGTGLQ